MILNLDTFICLDIETTGLDPDIDRITEIGALKYEQGIKKSTFSQLVNPGISIPPDIVKLTGIDDELVSSAPPIDEVIVKFENFLGDFPLVVGQNVGFDISFLKNYLSSKYLAAIDTYFIDTSAVARLVWPGLKSYGLASLVELISVKNRQAHRALADAEVTAEVFLNELGAISRLPQHMVNFIAGLLFDEAMRGAVLSSIDRISKEPPDTIIFEYDYGSNVVGESAIKPADDYLDIDIDRINEIFDNRFRDILGDYEERPQQLEMASQIAGAFNRSEIFLAEAPTGIGKSLAYLVPALLWSHINGESVIISTQTKNLQDQLLNKDIPQVARALDFKFKGALVKGRGNYLCLFKYYELLNEAIRLFDTEQKQALFPLVVWAETTLTGDIAECTGFSRRRNKYIWSRISCEGNFCLGKSCSYYKRCFLIKIKNESSSAHIKVVNHHLFFADFASGGELIRTSGHAILDEAHNLEKVAATYLGPAINLYQFITFFNQLFTIKPIESGLLLQIKYNASGLTEISRNKFLSKIKKVQQVLLTTRKDISAFFDKLAVNVSKQPGVINGSKEISYDDLSVYIPDNLIEKPVLSLKKLESLLTDLAVEIELVDSLKDKDILGVRCRALKQDLNELRKSFEFLVYPDDKEFVFWLECQRNKDIRLVSAPLEVGRLLDEKLYEQLKTLILSSATLSVAGNFSYIKNRLGLDLYSCERTFELALDSPFNLDENIGFFEASFIPFPAHKEFDQHIADTIYQLFSATDVKGMVLFTSYKSITAVVERIGTELIDIGFELFVQEGYLSPFQLLSRYRQSSKGIIFGTDSFWEGVDLPGDELELLVIARLPFSVPNRPWIKANLDKISTKGGNPFVEFSLPEAVIKFRQGFGRLIRKKTDRGCVVVLDSRLNGKQYGRYFTGSVKPALCKCQSPELLIKAVKQYLGQM